MKENRAANYVLHDWTKLVNNNTASTAGWPPLTREQAFDLAAHVRHGHVEKIMEYTIPGGIDFNIRFSQNLSPIRNVKDALIFIAGLFSATAIEGGMDYQRVMLYVSYMIDNVERMRTPEDAVGIAREMLAYFASQVGVVHGNLNLSSNVRNTNSYILSHIEDRLTVQDIADALHLNPNYLSHQYKMETGIPITTYIRKEKLSIAKWLLQNTDMKIADISEFLSFSSQQYFQRVFMQETGQTPLCWRNHKEG